MPVKETLDRARKDKPEGKARSTQAGEFVREEMDHIREGKHGAKNTKQAIAIGLNKARAAGVDLKPPRKGRTSDKTRKSAESAYRKGHSAKKKSTSSRRSKAVENALKKMPKSAASKKALSKQAKSAAKRRSASSRSAAAKKAARTRAHERKAA
jgi:hypothetical protein